LYDSPSTRIRQARSSLANLLLEDELAQDDVLVGPAAEGLNRIVLELDDLAGCQELFELWIGTKK
jgi:hypothetical protein